MPKLLFFDIDGTLFDDSRQLPASVAPALRQARVNGCRVFLNTGLPKSKNCLGVSVPPILEPIPPANIAAKII